MSRTSERNTLIRGTANLFKRYISAWFSHPDIGMGFYIEMIDSSYLPENPLQETLKKKIRYVTVRNI